MKIEVSCDQILRFDKEAGGYIRCEHRFSVADKYVGQKVACPECGGSVEVPPPSPLQNSMPTTDAETSLGTLDELLGEPLTNLFGDSPLDTPGKQIDAADNETHSNPLDESLDVMSISLDTPADLAVSPTAVSPLVPTPANILSPPVRTSDPPPAN